MRTILICCLLSFISYSIASQDSEQDNERNLTPNAVNLTDAEKSYLQQKGAIKMCVDPDWMPYERINKNRKHEGMAADYLIAFSERAGIKLQLVETTSWNQTIEFAKNRHCDIISMARKTKSREVFLNFTKPYIYFPVVIATSTDKLFIDDISREKDKTFAVVKGYSVIEHIQANIPDLKLLEVADITTGLEKVRSNEVFGYIDSILSISYAIQQNAFLDLKISGELDFRSSPSVASRNDEPILNDIFQKAIDSVTEEEKQAIYNRWVSVRFEKGIDYTLLIQVLICAFLVLIGVLYWNRKLALAHRIAQNALDQLNKTQVELEQKNNELETLAVTDKLTGLYNRIRLDSAIDNAISNADNFGVVILDVDLFKQVNDHHGHQVGDHVLIEIAKLIATSVRNKDTAARWGGEEFLILCHDTTPEGLDTFAERLRKSIEQHQFTGNLKCTVSLGYALYQNEDSRDSLINKADKALYRAKNLGRNRVEAA